MYGETPVLLTELLHKEINISHTQTYAIRCNFPNREEEMEGYRNVCTKQFHDLYCSSSIIKVIKLGLTRWTGYVACIRDN